MKMVVTITENPLVYLHFLLVGDQTITVDYGDGTPLQTYTTENPPFYEYSVEGTYTVIISGSATRFGSSNNYGSPITSIIQWGSLGLQSLSYACFNITTLISVPTSLPPTVTDTSHMFYGATSFNSDISRWDVSNVTNMAQMFTNASSFNSVLSGWDVSNVTDMNFMFSGATSFNQDIGSWQFNNTYVSQMFYGATSFNGDLSGWDVSNVTQLDYMFYGATSFNSDISMWDVSNVTDMSAMFNGATSFNRDLSGWNVANINTTNNIFCNCPMLDHPEHYPSFTGNPNLGC